MNPFKLFIVRTITMLVVAPLLGHHPVVSLADSRRSDPDLSPDVVEKQLLKVLGLDRRPRPLGHDQVPDYMIKMYEAQSGLTFETTSFPTAGKMTGSANTLRSSACTNKKGDAPFPIKTQGTKPTRTLLRFDLNRWDPVETLTAAELRLHLAPERSTLTSKGPQRKRRLFSVSILELLGAKRGQPPRMRTLDTLTVNAADPMWDGWHTLDVLPAVQRWRQTSIERSGNDIKTGDAVKSENANRQGLVIEIQSRSDSAEDHVNWSIASPTVLVYTDDGRTSDEATRDRSEGDDYHDPSNKRRTRRSPRHRRKFRRKQAGRNSICRRRPLYVDFQEVGWNDWVVAPPGYDAFYCRGECPFPLADHLNSTNHAIVQTLVNGVNPSAVPRACCVPTDLSPISMLYLDEQDKVVLKRYKDMVVQGCGCR